MKVPHSKVWWVLIAALVVVVGTLLVRSGTKPRTLDDLPEVYSDIEIAKAGEQARKLVPSLISPTPPPYPDFSWEVSSAEHATGFVAPEVEAATRGLVELGPPAFVELARHLNDTQYSYSTNFSRWRNHDVGERILANVLAVDIAFGEGSRKSGLGFFRYLEDQGSASAWAARASRTCRSALRLHYIEWFVWAIGQEDDIESSRRDEILEPYTREMERLRATGKRLCLSEPG